ncbi:MAG: permease [Legionellales bacterium RIFCSPHIGHO2_12_FULL_42_9]|nr:MAG: permease [Legionellales bacterium RIFCSPHIGHO2_12_FULL_42_9]
MIAEILNGALVYSLVGIAAGFLSGLFGIGGGIIVVPALLYIFKDNQFIPVLQLMRFAVGTSLAIMLFTSFVSIRSHQKLGEVLWSVYQRLWFWISIGVIAGSVATNFMPTYWIKTIFAVFLLFISWKMLTGMGRAGPNHFPSRSMNSLVNFVIGLLSGLLGVGGGTLIIPYLTYCGVDSHRITAVTVLCSLTIALLGTFIFMILGSYEHYQSSMTLGYIYWPAALWVAIPSMIFAPMGARLTYVLPVKQLRYAFVVLLLITAVNLLT